MRQEEDRSQSYAVLSIPQFAIRYFILQISAEKCIDYLVACNSSQFIVAEDCWINTSTKSKDIINREAILGDLSKEMCKQRKNLEVKMHFVLSDI